MAISATADKPRSGPAALKGTRGFALIEQGGRPADLQVSAFRADEAMHCEFRQDAVAMERDDLAGGAAASRGKTSSRRECERGLQPGHHDFSFEMLEFRPDGLHHHRTRRYQWCR